MLTREKESRPGAVLIVSGWPHIPDGSLVVSVGEHWIREKSEGELCCAVEYELTRWKVTHLIPVRFLTPAPRTAERPQDEP